MNTEDPLYVVTTKAKDGGVFHVHLRASELADHIRGRLQNTTGYTIISIVLIP